MAPIPEDELAQAVRRGYVAAVRWLGNDAEAQEAAQEAARRAWAARDRYDPSRPFYGWYYRILKNLCLNERARRATRARFRPDSVPPAPAADALVGRQAREQALQRAIEGLAAPQREVLELRHFQDLSYAEIADALGVPEGTVMSRLFRARAALRAALAQHPEFAPAGGPHG